MKVHNAQRGNQSGQPGGGKGRREEVRGSGIYPGSGPLPPGPAKVEMPGQFGHRAPAAAQRGSRSAMVGQARAGGRTTAAMARVLPKRAAARRALAAQLTSYPAELHPEQWEDYLKDFSSEHEGWDSEIRVFLPEDTGRIETQGLPLEGVSLDYKANECTTTVSVGAERADHLQRLIPGTKRIIALTREELEIDATDGSRTFVRCRRQGR